MSGEKAFWAGMGWPLGFAAGCGLLVLLAFAGCTGLVVVGGIVQAVGG